ncbi:MAG: membrane protein insertion efficiency factor YidD [Synergistaceae bacterium]|nr:membrane protein insertion efficiency factor YidD [Synergistaceae bacterium]
MERSRLAGGRSTNLPRNIAIAAIKAYQKFLSPMLGPHCRFHPTCSQYALEAFQKYGFLKGMILSVRRLAKCGPWNPGGEDPVPDDYYFFKFWGR